MTSGAPTPPGLMPGAGRNESLQKAFDVLERLADAPRGLLVAEVARQTGFPRSTVTRLLASLFEAGASSRDDDGRWTVGPLIRRLADSTTDADVVGHGMALLHEASERLGETTMLAVPAGGFGARVLGEAQGTRLLAVRTTWVDAVITSLSSGLVRLVLAEAPPATVAKVIAERERPRRTAATLTDPSELMAAIDEVRRSGRSIVVDEFELGLSGVGCPVHVEGALVAMIAAYLPSARFTGADRDAVITEIEDVAAALAERLTRPAS